MLNPSKLGMIWYPNKTTPSLAPDIPPTLLKSDQSSANAVLLFPRPFERAPNSVNDNWALVVTLCSSVKISKKGAYFFKAAWCYGLT